MKQTFNRTNEIKKNVIASLLLKCVNILTGLLIIPLTIDYLNPSKYGIWLTISSIVLWLSYFDMGLIHGFRNKYAIALAKNDKRLAQEYLSTTYAVLTIIFGLLFLIILLLCQFINWGQLLNIESIYEKELKYTFIILSFFFCVDMVAKVFTTMLISEQKPALASFVQTIGQVLSLVGIFILTVFVKVESLVFLASILSGLPCLLLIFISAIAFCTNYHCTIKPSIGTVKLRLVKDILGLGVQFFIITISMLFIYNLINIILTRTLGPESVTQYNIAYKMFGVVYMIMHIVLTPFWSAFTDAYEKKDFKWMIKMMKKLELLWLFCIPILSILLLLSNTIYRLWIGEDLKISFSLSLAMSIYTLFEILGAIYMYLINGIGKVRLQLIVYMSCAFISIPLTIYSCRTFGVSGAIIVPTIVYFIQACLGKIQLQRILSNKATGIWNK